MENKLLHYTEKLTCFVKIIDNENIIFALPNGEKTRVTKWGYAVDGQSLQWLLNRWIGKELSTKTVTDYFSHTLGKVIRCFAWKMARLNKPACTAQVAFYLKDGSPAMPFSSHDLWRAEICEIHAENVGEIV